MPPFTKKYIVMALFGILLLATGSFFVFRSLHKEAPPEKQSITPAFDPKPLIAAVNKQVALPSGEEPDIATVSDVTKLPKEDFFKDAQNGDKILLYKKAKKVFLYRPKTDTVLVMAPLQEESSTAATVQPLPTEK